MGSPWGADGVQGGKNMISYLLFWIKTLYLQMCSMQMCSSGEQTWLSYTEGSHWAKPVISSHNLGQVAPVWHLDLIQAFKGFLDSPQPRPPDC